MPMIGLGTWKLHPPVLNKIIERSIEQGYRHFDCAAIYENEPHIGSMLDHILTNEERFKVKRKDLFITSKLWNTKHSFNDVIRSCEKTLKDLKLSYLDLYLIHWPFSFEANEEGECLFDENGVAVIKPVSIQETWSAMEELVQMKLVRSIGVSNFTAYHLKELLLHAKIKPAVNQIEMHPFLPQPQLLEFCTQEGIAVVAYSPLGSGGQPSLLQDPVIQKTASKEGLTPAQLLLSWGITRGTPVIPKTAVESRLKENTLVKRLEERTMVELGSLESAFRYCNPVDWWKRDCFNE